MSDVGTPIEDNPIIAKGKTKFIRLRPGFPGEGLFTSMDDITAGDGEKHDTPAGKAALANKTTCNVFRFLKACGIPVAFTEQIDDVTFAGPLCDMLKYEVVIRRKAYGSEVDRRPHLGQGHLFPHLVNQFFLKTGGKKWKQHDLVKDDPLIEFDRENHKLELFYPGHTSEERKTAHSGMLVGQKPFLILDESEVFTHENEWDLLQEMGKIARRAFLALEKAFHLLGIDIVDIKFEFGLTSDGRLLLADVVDSDSWRTLEADGSHMSKQLYRDGVPLDKVMAKFKKAADLTGLFTIPRQQIVLWRGSDKDDLDPFEKALAKLCGDAPRPTLTPVTCSAHKKPVQAFQLAHKHLAAIPDSVFLVYVTMSDGAGPMIASNVPVPTITVRAGYKDFPDDVWSSLRMPSNGPVMTMLDPGNSILSALQILAMHNPALYAVLRAAQEERFPEN